MYLNSLVNKLFVSSGVIHYFCRGCISTLWTAKCNWLRYYLHLAVAQYVQTENNNNENINTQRTKLLAMTYGFTRVNLQKKCT